MIYDALIFDLDGTLWNVNQCCTDAWNLALEFLGQNRRISKKSMDSVTGLPMGKSIDILLPGLKTKYPDIKNIFIGYEKKQILKNSGTIYPGVISGLKRLFQRYKLFIISNCQEWYLLAFLNRSGIKNLITDYDCHGKSGEEKYRMILEMRKKHSLKNPLYIGDTEHDKESARKAETDYWLVNYGFGGPFRGKNTVASFSEMEKLLLRM